jgi:bifunctional ADP-heptose synthase (sugar kinase/adenylyltransferase)
VQVQQAVQTLARQVEAFILLEQVDQPNTGVLTDRILQTLGVIARQPPGLLMVGDSRRGLGHFPPMAFKMNSAELARLLKLNGALNVAEVKQNAAALARQNGHRVLVTLAEQGIVGAEPDGLVEHRPALPVRGEIDIVGAGDAVTANLTAALAAGATLAEALEMAMAAASVVIHQLGTTGTANVEQIRDLVS